MRYPRTRLTHRTHGLTKWKSAPSSTCRLAAYLSTHPRLVVAARAPERKMPADQQSGWAGN